MWGECRDWRNEIEEGGPGAPLSGGARAHLSTCAACRAAQVEGERLRQLLGGLGCVEPPADFDFRLRARMARGGRPARATLIRTRRAFGLAAACLAVFCGLAFLRLNSAGTGGEFRAADVSDAATNDGALPRPGARAEAPDTGGAGVETGGVSRTIGAADGIRLTGAGGGGPEVAASAQPRRTTPAAYAAALPARAAGRQPGNRPGHSRRPGDSAFGVSAARVRTISGADDETASVRRQPLAIPVGASDEPLRVLLRDERGSVRLVPTRSVSFGSQQIVARERGAQKTSFTDQEGVW